MVNFDIPVNGDMKPNPKNLRFKTALRIALVIIVIATAFTFGVFLSSGPSWSAWVLLCISAIILSVIGFGVPVEDIQPDSAVVFFVAGLITQLFLSLSTLLYLLLLFLDQPQAASRTVVQFEQRNTLVPLVILVGFIVSLFLLQKYCVHSVPEKHIAVITGIGNRKRISPRKLVVVWPFIEQFEKRSLEPQTEKLDFECVTNDRIDVKFHAEVQWQEDPKRLLHIVNNKIKGGDIIKSTLKPEVAQEANKHPLNKFMDEPKFMQTQMLRLLSFQLAHDPQKPGITVRSMKVTIELSNELTDLYKARKQMQLQEELAESSGKQEAKKLREIDQIATRSSSKTLEHLENMKNAEGGMLNRK